MTCPGRPAAPARGIEAWAAAARTWRTREECLLRAEGVPTADEVRALAIRVAGGVPSFPPWARGLLGAVAEHWHQLADELAGTRGAVPPAEYARRLRAALQSLTVLVNNEPPVHQEPQPGVAAGLRAGGTVLMLLEDFFRNFRMAAPFPGHILHALLDQAAPDE